MPTKLFRGAFWEDLHCVDGILEGVGLRVGPFEFVLLAYLRVKGQNVLVEGLVPGVVVGGGVVEFVEADCVAPAGDGAGGLVGLAGLVPGIFEGCVGGHGRQNPRCWLRGRRVDVAPPKHGFHASG